MDPIKIIEKYYEPGSKAYKMIITHSRLVTKLALDIARKNMHLKPDLKFIEEAAMLHDIGVFHIHDFDTGTKSGKPYACHGLEGAEILRKEGYPKHALVCERHIGVGLTKEEIIRRNLPLPKKDMIPQTVEEEIITFADKFYSKNETPEKKKSLAEIRKVIGKYGEENVRKFNEWVKKFGYDE